jgi:hypothetical protein
LHSVSKLGSFSRTFSFTLASDLADAILHNLLGFRRRQSTTIGREVRLGLGLRSLLPEANQLSDLFLHRHPFQEIRNPLVNG